MRQLLAIIFLLACHPLAEAEETSGTPPTTFRLTLASSLKNPLSQNLIDFKNAIEEELLGHSAYRNFR